MWPCSTTVDYEEIATQYKELHLWSLQTAVFSMASYGHLKTLQQQMGIGANTEFVLKLMTLSGSIVCALQ